MNANGTQLRVLINSAHARGVARPSDVNRSGMWEVRAERVSQVKHNRSSVGMKNGGDGTKHIFLVRLTPRNIFGSIEKYTGLMPSLLKVMTIHVNVGLNM